MRYLLVSIIVAIIMATATHTRAYSGRLFKGEVSVEIVS